MIAEGEMPPLQYRLIHGGGRLSQAEKDQLAAGLRTQLRRRTAGNDQTGLVGLLHLIG